MMIKILMVQSHHQAVAKEKRQLWLPVTSKDILLKSLICFSYQLLKSFTTQIKYITNVNFLIFQLQLLSQTKHRTCPQ